MRNVVAEAVALLTSTIQPRSVGNELARPIVRLGPETNAPPPSGTVRRGQVAIARTWAPARLMNESVVTTLKARAPAAAGWKAATASARSTAAPAARQQEMEGGGNAPTHRPPRARGTRH